jgi:hypothetical protein
MIINSKEIVASLHQHTYAKEQAMHRVSRRGRSFLLDHGGVQCAYSQLPGTLANFKSSWSPHVFWCDLTT